MPETKAISSAMAVFFFILMKFGLQSNGFFPKLLPSLQNFFESVELGMWSWELLNTQH